MKENGLFLRGIFCGFQVAEKDNANGTITRRFEYLVADGADPYTVSCDEDYSDAIKFGDQVKFKITVRAWNSRIYMNGELLEE